MWLQRGDFTEQARAADVQWRRGSQKRKVIFALPSGARVTGSGPELGFWTPSRAVTEAELPVGAVFEFKVVRGDVWADGDNRVLYVEPGSGALTVSVP